MSDPKLQDLLRDPMFAVGYLNRAMGDFPEALAAAYAIVRRDAENQRMRELLTEIREDVEAGSTTYALRKIESFLSETKETV